jgi:hypothetical protein
VKGCFILFVGLKEENSLDIMAEYIGDDGDIVGGDVQCVQGPSRQKFRIYICLHQYWNNGTQEIDRLFVFPAHDFALRSTGTCCIRGGSP